MRAERDPFGAELLRLRRLADERVGRVGRDGLGPTVAPVAPTAPPQAASSMADFELVDFEAIDSAEEAAQPPSEGLFDWDALQEAEEPLAPAPAAASGGASAEAARSRALFPHPPTLAALEAQDWVSFTAAARARREHQRATAASRAAARAALQGGVRRLHVAARAPPPLIDVATAPRLDAWQQAHASHALRLVGGFLVCADCGGYATPDVTSSRLLRGDCHESSVDGTRSRRNRLLAGRLPLDWTEEAWPDGLGARGSVRTVLSIGRCDGKWELLANAARNWGREYEYYRARVGRAEPPARTCRSARPGPGAFSDGPRRRRRLGSRSAATEQHPGNGVHGRQPRMPSRHLRKRAWRSAVARMPVALRSPCPVAGRSRNTAGRMHSSQVQVSRVRPHCQCACCGQGRIARMCCRSQAARTRWAHGGWSDKYVVRAVLAAAWAIARRGSGKSEVGGPKGVATSTIP